MTERNTIEIDYCPSCRGVWLDKGELDKMLDAAQTAAPLQTDHRHDPNPGYYDQKHKSPLGQQKPYKKKSFLGDLFDFD